MTTKPLYLWDIRCDGAGHGQTCSQRRIAQAESAHAARDQARNTHGWQFLPPDIDLCAQHARKD